jgi:hypothetical protein
VVKMAKISSHTGCGVAMDGGVGVRGFSWPVWEVPRRFS